MTRRTLSGRLAHLEDTARQSGPPSGAALLEALPADLRGEVEDVDALEAAARSAPAGLSGDLPALALFAFLSLPDGEA